MSGAPSDVAPGPILPEWARRLVPAEGFLTLGFVVLMALTVAWSFDDAAWVVGQKAWGDFYAWGTLIGALVAFGGAKAGWPRWVVHLVGAIAASLILPVMVGSILAGEVGGSPAELYRRTASSVVHAWIDLAILRLPVTLEVGHHLLAIGILCWATGQFAAYAVFGHRRPLDAVIVVGVLLLANMVMTPGDQIGFLVIFSIAALCILARTHAFDEETTWIRRRIGDATAVRSIYLRGGAVFIGAAVFGSLALTAAASSAPLAGFWVGFDDKLIEWSRGLQRFFPFGGPTRISGFGFGDSATITGQWESANTPVLTIRVPQGDDTPYYWRAVTFDRYDIASWSTSRREPITRRANQEILQGLGEQVTDVFARRNVTFQVEVLAPVGDFVFSPQDPLSVNAESRVEVIGAGSWFSALRLDLDSYTVTASVPVRGTASNGLTANRLRAAPTTYTDDISRLYIEQMPPNALGPNARALLQEFLDQEYSNPYDLADAMEERFSRSPEFRYDADVRDVCLPGISAAECFAQHRRGYCLHFATTMAMLLREAGVPARMALGYLPGERDERTGTETIVASGAHAWVEVYFPGFGWYAFDPTGGLSATPPLVDGPRVTPPPSIAPTFGSALPDRETDPPLQGQGNTTTPPTRPNPTSNPTVMIALAILLIAGIGGLAFLAWQRGPRGEITPDSVWRGVARMAGRFGFAPRPQQTVYEYAGTLGEVLPGSRPELQTVARAKVEVAYGRRQVGGDAVRALREAQRRLRLDLLRLAFRRRERRRLRGK